LNIRSNNCWWVLS